MPDVDGASDHMWGTQKFCEHDPQWVAVIYVEFDNHGQAEYAHAVFVGFAMND